MLLLYEYSNQNITEFQVFCNNSLSQAEKEKIFIPTYDCMKKYQGTWHIEPRPVFQDCMLIECENKENLIQTLNQNQCPTDIVQSIAAQAIHLHPEQQKFLQDLMDQNRRIQMSTGYIKDGSTHVTEGPLQGKENLIRRIDRHKRLARLEIPMGNKVREMCAGLEITSKS